jgi:hypothetical protein
MNLEETCAWIETFFKEQWIEVQDCEIDFSEHEPISTGSSLHIYEERYQISDDTYRLLYAIGSDSDEPLIEVLKKSKKKFQKDLES